MGTPISCRLTGWRLMFKHPGTFTWFGAFPGISSFKFATLIALATCFATKLQQSNGALPSLSWIWIIGKLHVLLLALARALVPQHLVIFCGWPRNNSNPICAISETVSPDVRIYRTGSEWRVVFPDGSHVQIGFYVWTAHNVLFMNVAVSLTPVHSGGVGGICGSYDNNTANDLLGRFGNNTSRKTALILCSLLPSCPSWYHDSGGMLS